MMRTRYPRPCPIPGHPQDQDEDEPDLVTESAWARLRAWHLQAPAERLPLPQIHLPFLFTADLTPADVDVLSGELVAGIGAL